MATKKEPDYIGFSPKDLLGIQAEGIRIRDNPRSMIPSYIEPSNADIGISALQGFRQSMQDSQQAAALGDPLLASLAAIGGAAGQPGPDAIAAQRQELQNKRMMAQLEATPLPDDHAIVKKHPEFKGLTLGMIQKLAPYIQRNEALEQRMALFEAAERGRNSRADASLAKADAKESAKTAAKTKAQDDTFVLYETARDGLLSGLGGSVTGPITGKIPALTAKQQIAEGSVAAMAPVLKQLFRVSGEGVFTDRDQQLLLDMIPTRKTHPEAAASLIQNIDAIVKAKLGMAGGGSPAPAQSTASAGGEVRRKVRTNQGERIGVWSAAGKFLRYE